MTTYLLDQFATNEAAPLVSPRTCEPGPGSIAILDSGNRVSIASQSLVVAPNSDGWIRGFHSIADWSQADQVAMMFDATMSGTGRQWHGGFSAPAQDRSLCTYGATVSDTTGSQGSAGGTSHFLGVASLSGAKYCLANQTTDSLRYRFAIKQTPTGALVGIQGGFADWFGAWKGAKKYYCIGIINDSQDGLQAQVVANRSGATLTLDDVAVMDADDVSFGHMRLLASQEMIGLHIPYFAINSNGNLLCSYQQASGEHTANNGHVRQTVSTDGGESWSAAVDLDVATSTSAVQSSGYLVRSNGDVWAILMSFDNGNSYQATLYYKVSTNGGATYGPSNLFGSHANYNAFGQARELPSGRIVVPVHQRPTPSASYTLHCLYSDDGGSTWQKSDVPMGAENQLVEPTIVNWQGSLVMLIRHRSNGNLWYSESADGGTTWSEASATNITAPDSRTMSEVLPNGNLAIIHNDHATLRTNCVVSVASSRSGGTFNVVKVKPVGRYTANHYIHYPAIIVRDDNVHVAWGYQSSSNIMSAIFTDRFPLSDLLSDTESRDTSCNALVADSQVVSIRDMQETSGVVISDTSGKGRNGIATNMGANVVATTGPASYLPSAIVFDGTNDYIAIDDDYAFIHQNGEFTVSVWAYLGTAGVFAEIIGNTVAPGERGFCLRFNNDGTIRFAAMRGVSGTYVYDLATSVTYGTGTWRHIVATADGRVIKLYVDGVEVTSGTMGVGTATGESTRNPRIGSNPQIPRYFPGRIAGEKTWSRYFAPDEVAELYAGPEPLNLTAPVLHEDGTVTSGTWDDRNNGTISRTTTLYLADDNSIVATSTVTDPDFSGDVTPGQSYYVVERASNDGGYDVTQDTTSDTIEIAGGSQPVAYVGTRPVIAQYIGSRLVTETH